MVLMKTNECINLNNIRPANRKNVFLTSSINPTKIVSNKIKLRFSPSPSDDYQSKSWGPGAYMYHAST